MPTVTISSKYQVVIPRELRERYGLKPGQKVIMLDVGGLVYLVPRIPLQDLYGFLKGVHIDLDDIREEEDFD